MGQKAKVSRLTVIHVFLGKLSLKLLKFIRDHLSFSLLMNDFARK
ncbi:hypothetical protein LACWKB8_1580 [Lactobacillus sp. wkB8]|nr:hypothetical protein LACWKB8_1580 [Lactobacillus sp. wkB8]